jgi:CheY-like chemotaxis protein
MTHDYVLIAEPDARIANTFESLAREAKLEALVARDGAEARNIMRERGLPALLVTNLVLPKLDGFALLAELRRLATAAQVPAMVVSSSMQLRTTALGLRQKLGIAEIVASGMVATTLRGALRRALATGPGPKVFDTVPPTTGLRSIAPAKGLPSRDPARLARIEALRLVDDAPPEKELQRLVEETARSFGVPIALLSLVLDKRQWFKAHVGLSGDLLADRGTPIEQSFCRHVVDADTATPLIVPDARRHPLFSDNALVQDGKVGSYAGAPLLMTDGTVLGTLCIIDTKPLSIGYDEVDQLVALARRVAGEIELRARALKAPGTGEQEALPFASNGSLRARSFLEPVLSQLEAGAMLMDAERKVTYANQAISDMVGVNPRELIGITRESFVRLLAGLSDTPEDVLRRVHVQPEGPFLAREELELARPVRRVLRWTAKPVRFPDGVAQFATYTDVTAEVELRAIEDVTFFVVEDQQG